MTGRVYILDACAVIAMQQQEPGAETLLEILVAPETQARIHSINLCEIYYDLLRRDPLAQLEALVEELAHWDVTVDQALGFPLLRRAGEIKARWCRISLADCIALSLAELCGGELLTTDHHELDPLAEAAYPIRFIR
ncbi:hypothetical protein Thiowin_00069 [Thiorhodovibrio winogradskyi]|uniref:PIN domain-containing protein n=1 Tax=Thiorhodovibrio winogradskyi TaxID=77007 RepID=A0ABZ0S3Q7_9GAMM|nr:PIN domain-containing protein [Thiorhodovibrio winogradskyi]